MKPASFEYHSPASASEALDLLSRYGEDAKLLAGGQSLVPLLNFRLAGPGVLIDLNRIQELAYIKEEKGQLRIGAMTRQRAVEFSPLVKAKLPLLTEATRVVGHLPTRSRGTMGGSLAHADPSAEYPCLITAMEGSLLIRGPRGERLVPAGEFFRGIFTTALQPDEMLVEARVPTAPPGAGWAFEEFSRRQGDFAIVAVAALLASDGVKCRTARLAVSGVGLTPIKLREVEQILERDGLEEGSIMNAARRASELVDPGSDLQASADYRRHLTRVFTHRALKRAMAAVKEQK